jgi:hypothetical protein
MITEGYVCLERESEPINHSYIQCHTQQYTVLYSVGSLRRVTNAIILATARIATAANADRDNQAVYSAYYLMSRCSDLSTSEFKECNCASGHTQPSLSVKSHRVMCWVREWLCYERENCRTAHYGPKKKIVSLWRHRLSLPCCVRTSVGDSENHLCFQWSYRR